MLRRLRDWLRQGRRAREPHCPRFNAHCWIIGEPEVGDGVWIGAFTVIDAQGGLKIGAGTDISSGAHVITHSTAWRCVSGRRFPENERAAVDIGECCFIGENATVLRGAKIGHHSIVGAGAVVTEFMEIPPYSLAVGVPARVVRDIRDEIEAKVSEASRSRS